MSDLHPVLQESLNGAIAHILAVQGQRLTPQDIESSVDHLFSGLIQGPECASVDWSLTWGHLIAYFWDQGASLYEANQLALSHIVGIVVQVCDGITSGQLDKEVDSLEKLEVFIRHAIDAAIEAEEAMEEA